MCVLSDNWRAYGLVPFNHLSIMSVVIAECITSNYWIHSLGCGKNATIWQPCRTSLPSDRSSAKSHAIWKCRAGELLRTRCYPERGKVFIHLRFLFASLPFFTELILTVLFSGIFCSFYLTILKFCLLVYCIYWRLNIDFVRNFQVSLYNAETCVFSTLWKI